MVLTVQTVFNSLMFKSIHWRKNAKLITFLTDFSACGSSKVSCGLSIKTNKLFKFNRWIEVGAISRKMINI